MESCSGALLSRLLGAFLWLSFTLCGFQNDSWWVAGSKVSLLAQTGQIPPTALQCFFFPLLPHQALIYLLLSLLIQHGITHSLSSPPSICAPLHF